MYYSGDSYIILSLLIINELIKTWVKKKKKQDEFHPTLSDTVLAQTWLTETKQTACWLTPKKNLDIWNVWI